MPRPGQRHSPEARAKISAANRTPEARARHGNQAQSWTEERKRAQSELTKQRMASPAVRAKISERTIAAIADPAVRQRWRVNQQAAMADPAVRQKISDLTKKAMADPAVRQRVVDGIAAVRARPDHGKKISAGIQKSWAADHEAKALREAWQAARPGLAAAVP
jgi:NUMOD3 motif